MGATKLRVRMWPTLGKSHLPTVKETRRKDALKKTLSARSHAKLFCSGFLGRFLRSKDFSLQNGAILRNAVRTSLPLVSPEKHAAQHPEKLRKKPSLNYETAALPAELRRREAAKHCIRWRLRQALSCSRFAVRSA